MNRASKNICRREHMIDTDLKIRVASVIRKKQQNRGENRRNNEARCLSKVVFGRRCGMRPRKVERALT